jgi:hypothetical protein
MAEIFNLGDNMRFIALVLCLVAFGPVSSFAADWQSLAKGEASINASSLPGPLYDPSLTIEEFNRFVAQRDPQQSLLVAVEVPRSELRLNKLVDRPVRFESQGTVYSGRVSAVFFSSESRGLPQATHSESVLVHALIENRQDNGKWMLTHGATGILSVRR